MNFFFSIEKEGPMRKKILILVYPATLNTLQFFKDFSLTVHDGDSNTDDEVLDLAYCSDDIGRQCWKTENLWRLLKLW